MNESPSTCHWDNGVTAGALFRCIRKGIGGEALGACAVRDIVTERFAFAARGGRFSTYSAFGLRESSWQSLTGSPEAPERAPMRRRRLKWSAQCSWGGESATHFGFVFVGGPSRIQITP